MKLQRVMISYFVLIAVFSAGCVKYNPYEPIQLSVDLTTNIDTVKALIAGKWQWVEDRRPSWPPGGEMESYTPWTRGFHQFMEFKGDTMTITRTGEASLIWRFRIIEEKEITLYPFDNNPVIAAYDLESDVLKTWYRVLICSTQMFFKRSHMSHAAFDQIYFKMN